MVYCSHLLYFGFKVFKVFKVFKIFGEKKKALLDKPERRILGELKDKAKYGRPESSKELKDGG
ncbi:hypothetical protein ADEMBY_21 [Bacillus phage Ademby]|uniref:Uncharacterized protein n=2 Tax=Claudivirus stitch TaxID=2843785 RepID=A0A3G8F575_9CAUD|nr:hypothetical protein BIZ85_gp20 [Bacillus phage Stitch]ANT41219.1 hypothetical protein STITCH_20 [Bacillus phage Stitch]AZF88328.1 hypothetical protein StevenHerd11_20 [Bacillus phage StevenHerd11]UIS65857.1 hypothetical protein ADEMBY_21 [Bacillus phage Ademby]